MGGLEEMAALGSCGNGTGGEHSPDAVAKARYEAVDEVTEGAGDESGEGGEGWPGRRKDAEAGEGGVGTGKGRFGLGTEDQEGVGAFAGDFVTGEQGCERWMAGGGKAEAVVGVAVEQPADGAVAKAALAVEDDEETVAELGRIFH
jgi:hypothetical protein